MRLDQVPGALNPKSFVIEFILQSAKYPERTRSFQLPTYTDIIDLITFIHPIKRKALTITKIENKIVEVRSRKDTFTLIVK
jgi:hypothetical protein